MKRATTALLAAAVLLAATGCAAAQAAPQQGTCVFPDLKAMLYQLADEGSGEKSPENCTAVRKNEVAAEVTPLRGLGDAMRTIVVMTRVVEEIDKVANQRLADLRGFFHTGGTKEALMFWTVPAGSWPVLYALPDEEETEELPAATVNRCTSGTIGTPCPEPASVQK